VPKKSSGQVRSRGDAAGWAKQKVRFTPGDRTFLAAGPPHCPSRPSTRSRFARVDIRRRRRLGASFMSTRMLRDLPGRYRRSSGMRGRLGAMRRRRCPPCAIGECGRELAMLALLVVFGCGHGRSTASSAPGNRASGDTGSKPLRDAVSVAQRAQTIEGRSSRASWRGPQPVVWRFNVAHSPPPSMGSLRTTSRSAVSST
jgi:hypothetical protein